MGALKQEFMRQCEQGIHVQDMSDDQMRERAINYLVVELGTVIEHLIELSLTEDELEVTVNKVIKIKTGERNDHPEMSRSTRTEHENDLESIAEFFNENE